MITNHWNNQKINAMRYSRLIILAAGLSAGCTLHGAEMTMKVTGKYLNIPISHKVDRTRLTLEAKGMDQLPIVARVAPDEAEYWVFKDISALKGK